MTPERLTTHKKEQNSKSKRFLAVAGPVLTAIALSACNNSVDLGPENVPFVSIDNQDLNTDGKIDIQDARLQKGKEWLPGLDFNMDFEIDVKDLQLIDIRVRTNPIAAKFDITADGKICEDDAAIVQTHIGTPIKSESGANERLDRVWGGWEEIDGKKVYNFDIDEIYESNAYSCDNEP